jgi:hypothetical protein
MTEHLKNLLGIVIAPTTKGELVPVPAPPPTLAELTATALRTHTEGEAAALTQVLKFIECGKALNAIKLQLPHGYFEQYIAEHFDFTLRTAQKHMRLARNEPKLLQLLETKAKLSSHLTAQEAHKFLDVLREHPKHRKR